MTHLYGKWILQQKKALEIMKKMFSNKKITEIIVIQIWGKIAMKK